MFQKYLILLKNIKELNLYQKHLRKKCKKSILQPWKILKNFTNKRRFINVYSQNEIFSLCFSSKKSKTISKKELFMRKLRNYLDIIDNPYSLATRQLKTEMQKEYNENY